MELVYLWVNGYKNLNRKEFNFNTDTVFEFTPEFEDKDEKVIGGILKLVSSDAHGLEDFFGSNLKITGIAGENGVGKTSIMEVLEKFFFFPHSNQYLNASIVLLFKNDAGYKLISNIDRISDISIDNFLIQFTSGTFEDIGLFTHFSEMPYQCKQMDGDEYSKTSNPCFTRGRFLPPAMTFDNNWSDYKTVTFDKRYVGNFIYYANEKGLIDLLDSKVFSPTKIALLSNDFFEDVPDNINKIRQKIYNTVPVSEKIKPDSLAEVYERFMLNIIALNFMPLTDTTEINIPTIIYGEVEQNIEKIESFLSTEAVEKIIGYKFKYRFNELKEIPTNKEIELSKFNKKAKNLLFDKYFDFFRIEYTDDTGKNYSGLSHGEKTIFTIMLNILMKIGFSINQKEFILFLDEPDLSLHPQWQREFIDELVKLLNSLITNQHADMIQVIFTTHSPFLLSDLPKQNIIFLARNNDGTCKVVNGLNDKKETFGANINTLLGDSFFMNNKLMGSFARFKIKDLIETCNMIEDRYTTYINDGIALELEQMIKSFRTIHNLIGDEYIKNVVGNHIHKVETILHKHFHDDYEIETLIRKLGKDKVKTYLKNHYD